jgi:hypothetical protein
VFTLQPVHDGPVCRPDRVEADGNSHVIDWRMI